MAKKKASTKFVCNACGYESPKWMGRCPNCSEWNQMVEFVEAKVQKGRTSFNHTEEMESQQALPLSKITSETEQRILTDMPELNRVLGGGLVKGSLVLVGGDPGIGKSTLLLQVSAQLTTAKRKGLYVSGEESIKQTKLRAERLNVDGDLLYVYAQTDLEVISKTIQTLQPEFVVIDSIQTI